MQTKMNQSSEPQVEKRMAARKTPLAWFRDMRLTARLTLLVLIVSVPILLASNLLLASQAERQITKHAEDLLFSTNNNVFRKTETWLTLNENLLHQMASLPGIVSMDPAQQKPLLVATSKAFPYLFLVQTTDINGFNVARNDDQGNKDYKDREWYQGAAAGASFASQVLISRTTNQPSLNMATPIKNSTGQIVGVMSIVSDLNDISQSVLGSITETGQGTQTFIVDQTDHVIAHTDEKIAANLTDYKSYAPVVALRTGKAGLFRFTDDQGHSWIAVLTILDNGWGIITQQDSAYALASLRQFQTVSWLITFIAALLMMAIAYLILRQSTRAIGELEQTVTAIAAGDLTRTARVTSGDEVGHLAEAVNSMTEQLRENIVGLEKRVAERTRALSLSLEISRSVSTILNRDDLMHEVVNQLQKSLRYYHVQIYLFDGAQSYLEMVGGTGEAGQVMLTRGHKISAGKGLVGRAAETRASVLVGDTLQDTNWLANPLLPETRSELAVPFSIGGQVMGVLDVQQNTVNGLTQLDVQLVETVANQIGIALQNADAFTRAQEQASYEGHVAEIGQKIQRTSSIDEALQVAISELGQALNAQRSSIELHASAISDRKN